MKADDIITLAIAGRQRQYRLTEWATSSALVAVDDKDVVRSQKGQIIAYHDGEIIRRKQRSWAD